MLFRGAGTRGCRPALACLGLRYSHVRSRGSTGARRAQVIQVHERTTMAGCAETGDRRLFEGVVSLVQDYLASCRDRSTKVVDFKQPAELHTLIDVSLRDEGESDDVILELCKKALQYSVHTGHPRFYNQLFSGVDVAGMCGVLLATATNTSMYTYEMAPVFGLMETEVLQKMRDLIGWSHGDGIFSPGGSISNLYGLIAARYHHFPEIKEKGILHLPQMVIFASEESHYSVKKMATVMGLGIDNVISVKCDIVGRMDPSDLEKAVHDAEVKGQVPLAVVGTCGTTVMGAFDPLNDIAAICKSHGVWLHVDACFGGSVLMSQAHKHLTSGIDLADSVSWNPHKALTVPLQCSAFLTRHPTLLSGCLSVHASYLFQKDKRSYDVSLDTGDKSMQCGRLNDAMKIWLMWKRGGMRECERMINQRMQLACYLREQVKKRDGFQLVVEEQQFVNVSFWYLPPCLRSLPDDQERSRRLNQVAPRIKAAMVEKGSMMVGYQPLRDFPNFFRMVVVAPAACHEDMDFVLDEIERLGEGLDV